MAKYVKLGDKAESFSDPFSGLNLAGKEVKELTGDALNSNSIKNALKGGHLSYASEFEFTKAGGVIPEIGKEEDEEETIESEFGKNAEELIAYYKKTYDVKAADVKAFKKLTLQEMVDELTKLAE
jgi:hypothetical protein